MQRQHDRDGGLDAASGSCSPWRRPASHCRLRARLCRPSTRRHRPGTSRSVPSAGLADTSAPRLSAMSRPVVILCAYLARQVTERWQQVKLPAREVRGSSIPRLGHAELDAAQNGHRRRRTGRRRQVLPDEIRALGVVTCAGAGAQISRCAWRWALEVGCSNGLCRPRSRPGLSATLTARK